LHKQVGDVHNNSTSSNGTSALAQDSVLCMLIHPIQLSTNGAIASPNLVCLPDCWQVIKI